MATGVDKDFLLFCIPCQTTDNYVDQTASVSVPPRVTLNFPAIKPFPGSEDATLGLSRLIKKLLLLLPVLYKEGKRWHTCSKSGQQAYVQPSLWDF